MKSENYLDLLIQEYNNQELTNEDLKNTLKHYAKLYHEENKYCLIIKQDFESQIKAFNYIVQFYEIISLSEIVEKRDKLLKELELYEKTT